jgi:hypothetical protein
MAVEKVCTKCRELKSLALYYKDARASDGRHSGCIECHKKLLRANALENRAGARARTARYRKKNPDAGRVALYEWRKKNPDRMRSINARYSERHPEQRRANVHRSTAKRKAQKLRAMPTWADQGAINEVYKMARIATRTTGQRHHVDHIVPLISKIVCGLHVHANLQILSESENTSKSNRFWPDMP